MKIKEGAYYRTRGGQVVGPMLMWVLPGASKYPYFVGTHELKILEWGTDGQYMYGKSCFMDLISEVYVRHTPPADAPAPETKTLRDELVEKAALAILSGYYANPSLGPSKNTFGDVWNAAKEFVEARKK
jgi:hypothetical protein